MGYGTGFWLARRGEAVPPPRSATPTRSCRGAKRRVSASVLEAPLPPPRGDLPRPQREPELQAVARVAQVAAGQLLDAAHAVAQRVAVDAQPRGGVGPAAVGLDESAEGGH